MYRRRTLAIRRSGVEVVNDVVKITSLLDLPDGLPHFEEVSDESERHV